MSTRPVRMAALSLTLVLIVNWVPASAQGFLATDHVGRPSGALPLAIQDPPGNWIQLISSTSPLATVQLTNTQLPPADPSYDGLTYGEPPEYTQDLGTRSAKTGTGLDALPSFRGIKGLKNLPGGVGTLLMSNPQAGGSWYPEQNTDQPGTTLSMLRTDLQGAVPVYSKGANTFLLTGDVETTHVNTNAILPNTMRQFPQDLFNIAIGGNYYRQFEGGNIGGIVFDVGTATDKPFQSSRDALVSGTAFLLMPQDETGSWFVGVNASTNSQVLAGLPIPGGGYFYHPNDEFQAIMGFPFSVFSWKPAKDWQMQYVWAFLTTMHARTVYQPSSRWQAYSGFDWTNENWRLSQRVNEDSHFFYYEKRLVTGMVWWVQPNVGLDVATGWAFDRYFSEIDGFELKGIDTVEIDNGIFVSARIDVRF
ncbi:MULTISPECIES: hypothetical protein [unclassified Schlesneria]|uniref:hypothetical protein n=3 Tax=Planctomycetaceae TaxID=126 RepID=UPI0035A0BE86